VFSARAGKRYVRKRLGRGVANPATPDIPRAELDAADPTAQSTSSFRVVRREPDTPLTSALLLVLGGFFIVAEGFVDSGSGVYFSGLSLAPVSGSASGLGVAEIALGVVVMVFAISLYVVPALHRIDGAIATLLAMSSLALGGGFLFGAALGIAGGVLAISWKPNPPFYVAPLDTNMCRHCGGFVPSTPAHAHCPTCHLSS